MTEPKYAVTNMLREDYEPFKKYCNDNNIVIKDALAEATKMWLDSKQKPDALSKIEVYPGW